MFGHLKLFLDIEPSSSADVTRELRGCFRDRDLFICISFRFKAKENLQRCGLYVFFDILITSKGASAFGML